MKKTLLILICVLTHIAAQAQEDSIRLINSIGFGYQYTQFQGMSSQMQSNFGNNYNIDAGAFSMNFAFYSIYKRFMLGGEFGGLQRKATDDDFMSSTVSQGFGYFNFGYLIIDKPGCMLFPFVGIGGIYSGLTLKNKTTTDWIDEDYLIRPGQKGNFSSVGGSINAGISFRKTCSHQYHDKRLQLGLDLGVHITPIKRDWMYDGSDQKVDSFGSAENIGYYARFTIGGLMSRAFDKK
ncbi:hypothetical protein [Cytophaga aurantiaca]|uniref:hypothetical protein n=1 Tax=Cytophaga aurantiaca TaxID=29530 RepID=UPI000361152A|nr:hypothetical protein [Cytophaga aurantiaca]